LPNASRGSIGFQAQCELAMIARMKLWLVALFFTLALQMNGEAPSSPRSKAAVQRVEPKLKEDLAAKGLKLGDPVFVRIFKAPATLEVWIRKDRAYERFRVYEICKFSGELGPKLKEGDGQAPEGIYKIAPAQLNPTSRFHLSFNLGYPNAFDAHHGRTGSALMVHGNCVSIGCYAMGDSAIEEIWTLCSRALESAQKAFPVHIFPFPLTDGNLKSQEKSPWIAFWKDLKPIYDAFKHDLVPPEVIVKDGRYSILPR
jgi:murein L,D-transpeptidase YafK